jgi:phage terminase large subunit
MTNGTLKICRCCENLIKEFSTYVWDTKASMRGEDKPVKQTDHCLDSVRYALFSHFFRKTGRGMTQDDVSRLERESNWDYQ